MVASKELSAGHARTLLGVKDTEDMILLAQFTHEQDLSVRQLEEQVKKINKKKKTTLEEVDEELLPVVDYFREMELKVQRQLGRKVKIEDKGKKKTLTLYYEDNEDLDELLTGICGKDFLENF
jgi:ParB family chromosome partitioning protein